MITIISATNREGSMTAKLAAFYSHLLSQINFENQIMDLCDLPKDFIFSNFNGSSTPIFMNLINRYIDKADKFIILSPEYHGSYPGILKCLIDCISSEIIKSKKVALVGVSSGRGGNLRGVEHLTSIFHHLQAEVFSMKTKFSDIDRLFNSSDKPNDSSTIKIIQNHIDSFIDF